MNKIAMIFCLLFLVAGAACQQSQTETGPQLPARTQTAAPNFVLHDVQGKEVTLSGLRGKVVLLEFWATWCPPCRATIPELIAIQEKYASKGLIVLGVSLDEGENVPGKLASFARENKINYQLLIGNEETERAYNVTSIPMTFLIDRQGNVITSYLGYVDDLAAAVSQKLEKAI
ncbi:MAG: TlpA disulfide reductase family protein [Nitrospiraceae bacterium]|nr:TlpA disulfide reductase family protein [Nitrospiraceae bacterium]